MMAKLRARSRSGSWKALCGVAIVAVSLGGVPASAATPTKPAAPTITSVRAVGNRSIEIRFAKPASDGGSRVSGYHGLCASTNGGVTATHSATHSPVVVVSLTAGKTYTCTVSASNVVGVGPASVPSSPVVARPTPPGAPTVTSVTATGLRSITVAFTKPASNGGARISNYRAACSSTNGGTPRSRQASTSPITVAGLTAADTYTCTAAAHNNIGFGTASAPSSPVVARPTAPGAPTIISVKAIGQRSVSVTLTKPANDGGAPITNYLVTCTSSNGGAKRSRLAHAPPIRVAGLTAGKTYTCTVAASNNIRFGPASPPSKPVIVRSG